MPDSNGRLRILTWHVHGNYLWYLTQVPHEFYLVTDRDRTTHHSGRSGTLPWGDNVHEAPVDQIRDMEFDVILWQSRAEYENEQTTLLSAAQQRLPMVYLEHDPPLEHPTDQKHWADDEKVTACTLAKAAGADFVKTSTGFASGGATAADVALMRRVVGADMGVKASGGVRDLEGLKAMVAAGATRIGASAGVRIVQESKGQQPAAAAKGY